ncbi:hypothetical protein [endosymbiont 'TC1' of Trimyema compressum]|uniref:hypothetical protein n=1 Tax=endosymbiont 'TC1' of Trimyema compressum TaxID=243899 RepID=UPI00155F1B4D|nr:hypothetical protein [endosymbiont 'TC1' of Trimyema compressum]
MPYSVYSTENTLWRQIADNRNKLSFDFLTEKEIEVLVITGFTPFSKQELLRR